jgi:glycosyltransferase involved in cell wall biosynthesis
VWIERPARCLAEVPVSRRKRVAAMNVVMLVSAVFPPREGMGFYVWNLSRTLTRHGHHVQIITRGAARHALREQVEGITLWRPFFAPLYPFHVHLHGLFVAKLIRTLEAQVDIFHCHSPLVPPTRTIRPVLLTFHSTVRDDIQATRLNSGRTLLMKLQAPVSVRLEVENLRTATRVSGVSPGVVEALKRYPHCPPDVPVVWNGVDVDLFKPPADRHFGDRVLLSVGRLGPGKGLEDLIEAISIISSGTTALKVVIIGDGPLRVSLERRVNALGLAYLIKFEGPVTDRNRLRGYYQEASLFVLPSHHEGLPTVMLEAMASGCPILATRVGGIPSVVEEGVNGALVPPGDPRRLASAVQSLLADPIQLAAMGLRARQTIERGFSWEQIGERFIDLYSDLLKVREGHFAA